MSSFESVLKNLYLDSLRLEQNLTLIEIEARLQQLQEIACLCYISESYQALALGLWDKLFSQYAQAIVTNDDPRERAIELAFLHLDYASGNKAMEQQIIKSLLALDRQTNFFPYHLQTRLNIVETSETTESSAIDFPRLRQRFKQEASAMTVLKPGQSISGDEIFLGIWEPKDRNGNSLRKKLLVYAASKDLTDASGKRLCAPFKDAAQELSGKRNWHGHDGLVLPVDGYDTALYTALENGSGIGKWFMPPRELLYGKDINGNDAFSDHLYKHKETGAFKGTFVTDPSGCGGKDWPVWYWSGTVHRDYKSSVWDVRFSDGEVDYDLKDTSRLSCRPCRVEVLTL